MYNVIIVLDESRNKSYYHSYVAGNGNIECRELPPYQDILKARACYWDSASEDWIYDREKYKENLANYKADKAAADEAAKEAGATPSNAELSAAVMELAESINAIEETISGMF